MVDVVSLRKELEERYKKKIKPCIYHSQCEFGCKKQFSNVARLGKPVGAFIGDNYSDHRIVFIGINTNEANGLRSIYKDKDYSKGVAWDYKPLRQLLKVHFHLDVNDMSNIAFTNIIKCSWISSNGKSLRSKPAWIQWVNCVHKQDVIGFEIDVIKPKLIFAVGDSVFDELRIKFYKNQVELIPNHLFQTTIRGEACGVARLPHLFNPVWPRRRMKDFNSGTFPNKYKPIFDYFQIYQDGKVENMRESMYSKFKKVGIVDDFGTNNELVHLTVLAQLDKLRKDGIIPIP